MKTIFFLAAILAVFGCMPAVSEPVMLQSVINPELTESPIANWAISQLVERFGDNPTVLTAITLLTMAMPLLMFIANHTKNPHDNALLILLNKILQTLTGGSAKNQADVLRWKTLLTNKPSKWPELIYEKSLHFNPADGFPYRESRMALNL